MPVSEKAGVWSGLFGIWKRPCVGPDHQPQSRVVIENVRQIAEAAELLGTVVNGVGDRQWDSRSPGYWSRSCRSGNNSTVPWIRAARGWAGRHRGRRPGRRRLPPGSAVVPSLVSISTTPAVRRPYCAGRVPGDEIDAVDESAVDRLAEAADALRKLNAIDTILHIGVLAADMQRAGGFGVLGNARQAQKDFVHRRVLAGAILGDQFLIQRVNRRADLRR